MQMQLARPDHPVAQRAAAEADVGAPQRVRHTVQRRAVDVFVGEHQRQRRWRGDATRQRLRRHRRGHNRGVQRGALAVTAGIFEPHMLQHRRLHLDVQLLGDGLAHPMHPIMAARTVLLILTQIMFDALARQIVRQRLAAACLRRRLWSLRQSRVRHGDRLDIVVVPAFSGGLLGFVEDALLELFALRRIPVQALQAQLLLKMQHALCEFVVFGLQRRDLGRVRRDQGFQLVRRGLATHRSLESKSCRHVNRAPMSSSCLRRRHLRTAMPKPDDAARIEHAQPTL